MLLFWFIGALMGYGFDRWITPHASPKIIEKEIIKEKIIERCTTGINTYNNLHKEGTSPHFVVSRNSNTATIDSKLLDDRNPKKIEAAPISFGSLSLTEIEMNFLEDNIDELRNSITLSSEDQGWKVHFIHTPNPFQKVGFRDNDFIRYEPLKHALNDPDTTKITSRILDILHSLE